VATSVYFNNFAFSGEQRLVESLIIESIKIFGYDAYYMPRSLVKEDHLFGEDILSEFNEALLLEMYVKTVDGFEGDRDFLTKFNLEIRDQITFSISKRRFGEEVLSAYTHTNNDGYQIDRPAEGDLIYFPLSKSLFEIKFIEDEAVFYQMGELQTYDITCEMMEYSSESIDTGVDEIDIIEDLFSTDNSTYGITLEDDSGVLLSEEGETIIQEGPAGLTNDNTANNNFFTTESREFLDFSEQNPFGEGNW
jgi:hypothetical protein